MRFALPMLKARVHRASLGACRMNTVAAPVRVLLVEPHDDNRELYHLGLTAAGFQVWAANDTTSATDAFAAHAPTVVVCEMRLLGGTDLLRRFAAAGVPVIALTT